MIDGEASVGVGLVHACRFDREVVHSLLTGDEHRQFAEKVPVNVALIVRERFQRDIQDCFAVELEQEVIIRVGLVRFLLVKNTRGSDGDRHKAAAALTDCAP